MKKETKMKVVLGAGAITTVILAVFAAKKLSNHDVPEIKLSDMSYLLGSGKNNQFEYFDHKAIGFQDRDGQFVTTINTETLEEMREEFNNIMDFFESMTANKEET